MIMLRKERYFIVFLEEACNRLETLYIRMGKRIRLINDSAMSGAEHVVKSDI